MPPMFGPVLPPAARRQWEVWMKGTSSGALGCAPPSRTTGSQEIGPAQPTASATTMASLIDPGRAPLLLAARYAAGKQDMAAQESVLWEVGRLVVTWQVTRSPSG